MRKNKTNYWNYRIFKNTTNFNDEEYINYSIIEVYYDSKDNIIGYSDHMYPYGETEYKLKLKLSKMLKAYRLPTLTVEDLNPKKKNVKSNLEK